jgi:antitoxin (DNA-binding transcriptional repressor) of toxin-antitoxin stability system
MDVKVTDLRQNLPAYLAKVARGERIRVTSRSKVIAELSPPGADEAAVEAARRRLRGSVRRFIRPLDPVFSPKEWGMNR